MADTNLKDMPDEYWRDKLTDEQYRVTRQKGTEQPFSGAFVDHHADGSYTCVACGYELFGSETKYDSRSGWPSFTTPVDQSHIDLHEDVSHGMTRTEVTCARCGAHLGHVFPDGPADAGGMRYCINSLSLDFNPRENS